MKRFFPFAALLATALVLGACEGGGNTRAVVPPMFEVIRPDKGRDTISYLKKEKTRFARFADGHLPFFDLALGPPVVVLEESSESARPATERAVRAINQGLPDDWQISVSEETEPDGTYPAIGGGYLLPAGSSYRGTIVAQAAGRTKWRFPGWSDSRLRRISQNLIGYSMDFPVVSGPLYRYGGGKIWADNRRLKGRELASTIAHEIIHVLGRWHVNKYDRPRWSVMQTGQYSHSDILYPADRGALQAIYATVREPIRFDTLKDQLAGWDDNEYEVSGSFEDISLGVWARYGVPGEEDDLIKPRVRLDLAPGPAFQGSAAWSGLLLGMTSDKDAVQGRAEVTLSLVSGSMQGRVIFSELVSVASGDPWRQGSVSYSLEGTGNRFSAPGERIGGTIHGAAHKAVTGTLRDQGFTAVFGATM